MSWKNHLCTYCNQRDSTTTGDHVPPKAFFPKGTGIELITVPCCTECNSLLSALDERVRNTWTSLENVEKHPFVRDFIQPSIRREFSRKPGKQRGLTNNWVIPDSVKTDVDLLTTDIAVKIDSEVEYFIQRMTKALILHDQGFAPPPDSEFGYKFLDNVDKKVVLFYKHLLSTRRPIEIGDQNIFVYATWILPEKHSVYCYMNFYDALPIGSLVVLPEYMFQSVDDTFILSVDSQKV